MRAGCLALFAGLLCAGSACAQLGQTRAEIARQFGAPVQHHARVRDHQIIGGPAVAGDVHLWRGYYLRVVYRGDESVQAEFSRREGPLARAQVDAILAMAGDGSTWRMTPGSTPQIEFYRRLDDQALASWTAGPNGSLLIASDDSGAIWRKLLSEAR